MIRMDSFVMDKAGIALTTACSLSCKLCAAYAPYNIPEHYALERHRECLKRFFSIVTQVNKFTISGGEPLVYPDLPGFFAELQRYRDRLGTLELITNGTILPSRALLSAMSVWQDKLAVLVDNYGPDISSKADEIHTLLSANGITHSVRNYTAEDPHCGGWIDFGDLTQKRHLTQEEQERLYAKCAQPQKIKFCFTIVNGIVSPCPPLRRRQELGLPTDYCEYIDLFDDSLTVEEQRRKIWGIYHAKSLSACAYCDGLCDDSIRYLPAQQFTTEEKDCVKKGARFYAEVRKMICSGGSA